MKNAVLALLMVSLPSLSFAEVAKSNATKAGESLDAEESSTEADATENEEPAARVNCEKVDPALYALALAVASSSHARKDASAKALLALSKACSDGAS